MIEQSFANVKSPPVKNSSQSHSSPTLFSLDYYDSFGKKQLLGVPKRSRLLPPTLLWKKWELVRRYLVSQGLGNRERDCVFILLRMFAYYSQVFPSSATVAKDSVTSARTFWRAVEKLKDQGLINTVNRFRKNRQHSNLYEMLALVKEILRYIGEHGAGLTGAALFFLGFLDALPVANEKPVSRYLTGKGAAAVQV